MAGPNPAPMAVWRAGAGHGPNSRRSYKELNSTPRPACRRPRQRAKRAERVPHGLQVKGNPAKVGKVD